MKYHCELYFYYVNILRHHKFILLHLKTNINNIIMIIQLNFLSIMSIYNTNHIKILHHKESSLTLFQ